MSAEPAHSASRWRARVCANTRTISAPSGRPQTAIRVDELVSCAAEPPDRRERRLRPRVGLTAGKVLGKAHERNRIKRRMREALRRHVELVPAGFDLILHPRRTVLTMEFAKLEAEIVRILQQARAEAARRTEQRASADSRQPAKPAS